MKQLLLPALLLSVTICASAQKVEVKLVKKAFDGYKTSILNDRGEEAVKYVDSRTIKYYGDILELVKSADSTKIETLNILDKLMVFSIRHRTSKEDILSFNGEKLLVYAIKSGMVGKNSVANNSIGDVTVDGSFAKGQLVVNSQAAPFYFNFYKEEQQWKLDITALFPVSTKAFKKMADESGQPENDFLFTILESLTGRKPGKEIWKKVN
jgi:hypothetical protein